MFLFYFRGLTLEEALAMLEDDDFEAEKLQEITIFPPDNATGELTDEDSGDEDIMTINNLPGSQLKAPTEIVFENDIGDDFSSEDDVPLSQIRQTLMTNNAKRSAKKKIRQIYQWVKDDLRPIGDHFDEEVYESQESPQQLFLNFFDEDLIQMIVTESNMFNGEIEKAISKTLKLKVSLEYYFLVGMFKFQEGECCGNGSKTLIIR